MLVGGCRVSGEGCVWVGVWLEWRPLCWILLHCSHQSYASMRGHKNTEALTTCKMLELVILEQFNVVLWLELQMLAVV